MDSKYQEQNIEKSILFCNNNHDAPVSNQSKKCSDEIMPNSYDTNNHALFSQNNDICANSCFKISENDDPTDFQNISFKLIEKIRSEAHDKIEDTFDCDYDEDKIIEFIQYIGLEDVDIFSNEYINSSLISLNNYVNKYMNPNNILNFNAHERKNFNSYSLRIHTYYSLHPEEYDYIPKSVDIYNGKMDHIHLLKSYIDFEEDLMTITKNKLFEHLNI